MNPSWEYDRINYLPDAFVQEVQRRAMLRRHIWLWVLLVGAMFSLWMLNHRHLSDQKAYANTLQQQIDAAEGQLSEVSRLEVVRQRLSKQVSMYDAIAKPIRMGYLTGAIGALTPDPIALSMVDLNTEVTQTKIVKEGARRDDPDAIRIDTNEYILIFVDGHAPSNLAIANYIGDLAGSGLFQNVKMMYSREGEVAGMLTREFRISMQVPLDRRYRLSAENGEVARAD